MELSQLNIFLAVVREGGVTKAARRLNRVQSNVTTRIRQLEEELGVELFNRVGKQMQLSAQGQVLLSYAEQLTELAEEARVAVSDPKPRGIFRLGAMESTAAVRLPAAITHYHRCYPQVEIELRTGNPQQLASALIAGELDAALYAEPVDSKRFDQQLAFVEDLVLVAPADQPKIREKASLPETVVVFESGCPHRRQLDKWFDRLNAVPKRTIELSSYHAMLGCVVAGMGVALLPRSVLSTFPESKRLSVHKLPRGLNQIKTMLVWRKASRSPNVEALAGILESLS